MKNKLSILVVVSLLITNHVFGTFNQDNCYKEDMKKFIEPEKIRDLEGILLKESTIGQFDDGIGVFANRDFKKGDVVIKWDLTTLSDEEYENLPEYEKNNFCHQRDNVHWLYPDPERHVNRFHSPNVIPDFERQANIALRDIKKGEELSIASDTIEDF